jgi:hypothetical protein
VRWVNDYQRPGEKVGFALVKCSNHGCTNRSWQRILVSDEDNAWSGGVCLSQDCTEVQVVREDDVVARPRPIDQLGIKSASIAHSRPVNRCVAVTYKEGHPIRRQVHVHQDG